MAYRTLTLLPALVATLLIPLALWGVLPALSDLWSLLKVGRPRAGAPERSDPRLLLLIPAHNEAALIRRCVESLSAQESPRGLVSIVVLADNCTDDTASLAAAAGATVLERADQRSRGKGFAIGWALAQLDWPSYDAVVILDADTTVDPDYYRRLSESMPVRGKAVQCYDGLSNENENWLTLLAGMITRNRYDLSLPLKQAAGLRVPLTGDGTLLGADILRRHGWREDSLTEGWDLYARLTLAGETVALARTARIYAQEARSLEQAGSQRARWTSGRMSVLRENWKAIVASTTISLHQKLDLVAELSSPGPVLQVTLAVVGLAVALALPRSWPQRALVGAFAVPVIHHAVLSGISLARHPRPLAVLTAGLRLPFYAVWRVAIAGRLLLVGRPKEWARTARHEEDTSAQRASDI